MHTLRLCFCICSPKAKWNICYELTLHRMRFLLIFLPLTAFQNSLSCPKSPRVAILFSLQWHEYNLVMESNPHLYFHAHLAECFLLVLSDPSRHSFHYSLHYIKQNHLTPWKKAHEGTRASCLLHTQYLTLCSVFMVWNHLRCYRKQVLVPLITSPLHKAGAQHTSAEQNWLFFLQSGKGKTRAMCPMRRAAFPVIPNSTEETATSRTKQSKQADKKRMGGRTTKIDKSNIYISNALASAQTNFTQDALHGIQMDHIVSMAIL